MVKFLLLAWIFMAVGSAAKLLAHLQLHSVRDNTPLRLSGLQQSNFLAKIPVSRGNYIYCTDTAYPNDIFCELSDALDANPNDEIYSALFEYANPAVKGDICAANFKRSNVSSPITLLYDGVNCYGDNPPLPMTRVGYVTSIDVWIRSRDWSSFSVRSYENAGSTRWSDKGTVNAPPIRFRFASDAEGS